MRIDKYLKETRLIKRRKTSKDLAEGNRVKINGKSVKPSYEVKVNDVIEVKVKDLLIKVKVIKDLSNAKNNQLGDTFEVIQDEN
jgi:ribosomal 50S subunit-recycling heat shock protein